MDRCTTVPALEKAVISEKAYVENMLYQRLYFSQSKKSLTCPLWFLINSHSFYQQHISLLLGVGIISWRIKKIKKTKPTKITGLWIPPR